MTILRHVPHAALAIAIACGATLACSDEASVANAHDGHATSTPSAGGATANGGGTSAPGAHPEADLFRAIEKEFDQKCGDTCHAAGTYRPTPSTFLAPPDAYAAIKAQPGVVVADFYQSILLTKGSHAGPALAADPTFEAKVIEWLKAEAMALSAKQFPSIAPVSLRAGANDIDLTAAGAPGLQSVHLKFEASLVGGVLSLGNMRLQPAQGSAIHIQKPRFVKVLAKPNAANRTELADFADTFSNLDQTVPAGEETILGTGAAFMTAAGWAPFQFDVDKIRIEIEKLEPGTFVAVEKPKACKDPAAFASIILPKLRGQQFLNCSNCHGDGTGGLSLNDVDKSAICNQVIQKLNGADIPKSSLITTVTPGTSHQGGAITNIQDWINLFVSNKSIFF
jgi:hypothetical protein